MAKWHVGIGKRSEVHSHIKCYSAADNTALLITIKILSWKLCLRNTSYLKCKNKCVSCLSENHYPKSSPNQQINKRLCTSGVQYVAVVVNKMSILVILCSTPIRAKAWGVAVDAAGWLLLPSPISVAPSLARLMAHVSTNRTTVGRIIHRHTRRMSPGRSGVAKWTTGTTTIRCSNKPNPRTHTSDRQQQQRHNDHAPRIVVRRQPSMW